MASKNIGVTASTFDLLHAGHIAMLREAKSQCDYLICCLQIDPSADRKEKNTPIQTIVERYTQLAAVRYVDEIIVYASEQDLLDILQMYPINVRILGDEYKEKDFTGKDICRQLGIELYFGLMYPDDHVAHFAHIGGALTGTLFYLGNKFMKNEK